LILAGNHKVNADTTNLKLPKLKKRNRLERFTTIREFREGKNVTISQNNKGFSGNKVNHSTRLVTFVELYELAKNNGDGRFCQRTLKIILETLKTQKANS